MAAAAVAVDGTCDVRPYARGTDTVPISRWSSRAIRKTFATVNEKIWIR